MPKLNFCDECNNSIPDHELAMSDSSETSLTCKDCLDDEVTGSSSWWIPLSVNLGLGTLVVGALIFLFFMFQGENEATSLNESPDSRLTEIIASTPDPHSVAKESPSFPDQDQPHIDLGQNIPQIEPNAPPAELASDFVAAQATLSHALRIQELASELQSIRDSSSPGPNTLKWFQMYSEFFKQALDEIPEGADDDLVACTKALATLNTLAMASILPAKVRLESGIITDAAMAFLAVFASTSKSGRSYKTLAGAYSLSEATHALAPIQLEILDRLRSLQEVLPRRYPSVAGPLRDALGARVPLSITDAAKLKWPNATKGHANPDTTEAYLDAIIWSNDEMTHRINTAHFFVWTEILILDIYRSSLAERMMMEKSLSANQLNVHPAVINHAKASFMWLQSRINLLIVSDLVNLMYLGWVQDKNMDQAFAGALVPAFTEMELMNQVHLRSTTAKRALAKAMDAMVDTYAGLRPKLRINNSVPFDEWLAFKDPEGPWLPFWGLQVLEGEFDSESGRSQFQLQLLVDYWDTNLHGLLLWKDSNVLMQVSGSIYFKGNKGPILVINEKKILQAHKDSHVKAERTFNLFVHNGNQDGYEILLLSSRKFPSSTCLIKLSESTEDLQPLLKNN